ncbi:MAG: DUF3943 domain-containing protein [Desulfobacteraceae bacterium]|nr:DUF3943 domain-containing protein [Desulfobacteraceae bacterium]MBU4055362.1 DUF3943 domain-containing protein [Pseudomonadota bacterium]
MERLIKTFKAILASLIVAATISMGGQAFAQEGEISGTVKDHKSDQGIQWVKIKVKDITAGRVVATGVTDAAGNYSVVIPVPGKYSLEASKRGYGYARVKAPDLIELSDTIPKQTVNLLIGGEEWLKYDPDVPESAMSWETGAGKSYLIPAMEIPTFLLLLNGYNRLAYSNLEENGEKVYDSSWSTFRSHLFHGPWGIDTDAFNINQFAHPYQGSMYQGFARSAGLNYWESLLYTNVGSLLWETAGETTDPSVNDQFASGIGGSFFGEVLFRMASLVLEGDGGKPGFWREMGAAIISPPTGINRLAFDNRFKPIFPSHNPATFSRLQLGVSLKSDLNDRSAASSTIDTEATVDFTMAYGLPGKPGYSYKRPLDYFHFEFISLANPDNPFDSIMIRGLLLGKDYDAGDSYRGIWGLYGGYDYISPHIFRVSSTSLSLGTTYQWWLTRAVALQGSVLGGVGYAAAGNVKQEGERDYHYGVAPQGLVGLRLILGERTMFDLTGRSYYLTGMGGDDPGGREAIGRLNMGVTVRVYERHALGLIYIVSVRDAQYPDRADSHQSTGTISLVYTLLGKNRFGAVAWGNYGNSEWY